VRRFELLRGLCTLAEVDGFDSDDIVRALCHHLLGDVVWEGAKVPDIIGALSVTEALTFARMCDVVTTGDVAIHWTDDRRCIVSASVAEGVAA
jgi:hypothetical protein